MHCSASIKLTSVPEGREPELGSETEYQSAGAPSVVGSECARERRMR